MSLTARGKPVLALLLLGALAGCAAPHGGTRLARPAQQAPLYQPGGRHYDAPGPPEDPWGPYIQLASARFGVSEIWIRAVMQQESGGQLYLAGTLTTSPVGAMGLMQIMPDTWETLRAHYGLGDDPYEPRDNILAGTAYIHEMYGLYGFPGFLAAYNAGPDRVDACLFTGAPLPRETVAYLSAVAPRLRPYAPVSGPLAGYADQTPDMADDLNRRTLMGQPLPAAAIAPAAPDLPCTPPPPDPSDHSADLLNQQSLAQAGGAPQAAPSDSAAEDLNRQYLTRLR